VRLSLVAAMDLAHGIGRAGGIPWRLPRDMRRFRALSMGKPLIMGRSTHVSIGKPLPGRENIVLSRDPAYAPAAGCRRAASLDEALALCASLGAPEAVVAGGEAVYREALPRCDQAHITLVLTVAEADAFFPREFPGAFGPWRVETEAFHAADADNALACVFLSFTRAR
jgi:dihydrofolate reductase